jgi:hypothetical protein
MVPSQPSMGSTRRLEIIRGVNEFTTQTPMKASFFGYMLL